MPSWNSVDEYIAAQPEPSRAALQQVRDVIRRALPGAEEIISYKIPAYRVHGGVVLYFAGWKQHFSLYPIGRRVTATLRDELSQYEFNNKGTVKFPFSEPVPAKLVERIARLRAEEVADRKAAAKPRTVQARKRSAPKKKKISNR